MRSVFFILLLLFPIFAKAQSPTISVDGKSNNGVSLEVLKIDVQVCGLIVKTSWEMTFRNHTNRVLEGNLNFPLKEGTTVSRYALDINGKMREAVPVNRAKGTVVFEAIERRRVDPGLLEKLDGNVFRTRIYPINPNSTRTVLIGYEEEMNVVDKAMRRYDLPMGLKDTVKQFSFNVTVNNAAAKPFFEAVPGNDLQFNRSQQQFIAAMQKTGYVPAQPLSFSIPVNAGDPEIVFQEFEDRHYFFVYTNPAKNERAKKTPAAICLLWDASISGLKRNIEKEINLLDQYFTKLQNVSVRLIVFNTKIRANELYSVGNGNWEKLRKAINDIQYDGATNFGAIDMNRITEPECILVSDGMQTFGSSSLKPGRQPMYCINSAMVADHSSLRYLSVATGAEFIDLARGDSTSALKKLVTESYRFLGIKSNNNIKEYYPSLKIPVAGAFTLSGVATEDPGQIVLCFGYGNNITEEKTIAANMDNSSCTGFELTKLFAQKKIAELDMQYEKNKGTIEPLGNRYGIITRNTSLIVLETVEDYIAYDIYPPVELREAYNRIMKNRSITQKEKKNEAAEDAMEMMADLETWWNKTGTKPVKNIAAPAAPVPVPPAVIVTPPAPPVAARPPLLDTALVPISDGRNRILSGTVTDQDGNRVPFASVKIKSSPAGITTDANGRYTMRIKNGDVLEIGSTAFKTANVSIDNRQTLTTTLERKNTQDLQEVIVTGAFNTRRSAKSTTSYFQIVSAEQLNVVRTQSTQNEVAGKVAGLQLNSQATPSLGREIRIRLRGENGLSTGPELLYVVDGTIVPAGSVDSTDILTLDFLAGPAASTFFGPEGRNGAIVINTKKANRAGTAKKEDNIMDPSNFNYLEAIKKTAPEKRYDKYLQLRSQYLDDATYFLAIANYFYHLGDADKGLTILSNLAEMSNSDYELFKMLGYKLKERGEYEAEANVFKKVLELRPLDPQSYRDYALALEDKGLYQKAVDVLYEGMVKINDETGESIYDGIEEVFLVDINRILAIGKQVRPGNIPKKLVASMPVDIRIVLNWNMSNTDIDLWVTDPAGEKCFFSNKETRINGRLSDDFTEGFGPEQFLLKKAIKGTYKIEVNYYGETQVTMAGPTTIMAEIYKHHGTAQQERKVVVLQMKKTKEDSVFVAELEWNAN